MIYYQERLKFKIGEVEYSSRNYEGGWDIDWQYNAKNDNSYNTLELTIYNLDRSRIENLSENSEFILSIGWGNYVSQFATGKCIDITTRRVGGVDVATTFTCVQTTQIQQSRFSKSYTANTDALTILRDIGSQNGYFFNQLELLENKVYSAGYCCYDFPIVAMRKIVNDCDSYLTIDGNTITIVGDTSNKIGYSVGFNNDTQGQLLAEPTSIKRDMKKSSKKEDPTHTLNILADPRINLRDVITVNSEFLKSEVKVLSISISNFNETLEVKVV